jgi:hypothetical protein
MANQTALEDDIRLIQQSIATLLQLQDLDDNELDEISEINTIARILEQLSAATTTQPQQPPPPPPTLSIPPLPLHLVHPQTRQPPPPPRTPPPRLHADRWYTPVSVERVVRGRMRSVKWFSDLQMAYIYVQGIVNDDENDDENEEHDWIIADFHETADMMDTRWSESEEGLPIARCDDTRTVFIAYYEPSETTAARASAQINHQQQRQLEPQIQESFQDSLQQRQRRRPSRRDP